MTPASARKGPRRSPGLRPTIRAALAAFLSASPAATAAAAAPVSPAATATAAAPQPLSPEVEALIRDKQREAAAARAEGIELLDAYLRDSPPSDETAEALFKLAELTWEEAQADYLRRMDEYQEDVAACKADRFHCKNLPKNPPRLDLSRAQTTYRRLIEGYPKFRKIDTVLYLYAFSLRDQGRLGEAIVYFQRILREFPRSRFRADAWMALAEHRFYERQDFAAALRAYEQVVKFPRSPLYGLALFKTAWCHWKLGQGERAASRFKEVLDLAQKAKDKSPEEQKRAAELQDQALDYLVQLFTEDDTKTAEDAYAFLAQIGGKAYSLRVLRRFADTVFDQTRYERAAQAYLYLLSLDANNADAPVFQQRIVEAFQALGRGDRAGAEMRKLALTYGPGSAWAKANADRPRAVAEARAVAETFIRNQAKALHAGAQRHEKESRIVDKVQYAQAAEAYEFYTKQFADSADVPELRYLRADILYFKLGDFRGAGHEYLAVGKSKPVGKQHKDALLQAMNAFERLRPAAPGAPAKGGSTQRSGATTPAPPAPPPPKKREITDDDRRFAEAADLYGTLFPDDKDIITVIFKNGQFFYDYGDYDEAVKRFGLIIERYGSSELAGPAGDRLLECLGAAKDYDNVETWARRLKSTKPFSGKNEQARLDALIVSAMLKTAERFADAKEFEKSAAHFQKVAREYPGHAAAPKALNNAGAAFEKAGRPEAAVAAYQALVDRHPRAAEAPEALMVAAKIEESIAAYARAATLFEQLATRYPQAPQAAAALRSAGLLRQALGQHERAIGHYASYEKQYKGRSETTEIAFQRGLIFVEKKDARGAAAAFADFVKNYPGDARVLEAMVREAEAHMTLGADARAKESLGRVLVHARVRKAEEEALPRAAEARYLQGELVLREYEKIKIAGKPRQLARALEDKARLLDDAKKVFLGVVTYRVPEWATAALYRIGQAYESFAKAMRAAKPPRDLSPEEQTVYREELEKSVIVIEDKALDAYRSGYAKALEIGVYNQYTRALRRSLAQLDRGEFPPEAETRLGVRLGELRASAFEPIEEVRRD